MSYEILTTIIGALSIIGFMHIQTARLLAVIEETCAGLKEARAKWLSERLSAEIKEARKEIKEIRAEVRAEFKEVRAEFKKVRAESSRKFVRI